MSEKIQILIVEDVAEDIELLERALRKDGLEFASRCVDSEQKLITALNEFVPDIIISDYGLVRFSGLDVIRLSKAKCPAVPVIIVTGTLNDVKAANTIKAGADDYIIKDRLARVGPSVRSVLEKRKQLTERNHIENMLIQSDKMAAIGTLTAGIAHELNNPLGYIMGNLDIMLHYSNTLNEYHAAEARILDEITDTRFQHVIDRIRSLNEHLKISYILTELGAAIQESREGAEKASLIVRDLNAFARMEKPAVKPADINDCIDKVINIVWNELKYKVELKRSYGEIPTVDCDVNKIEQVLMNLLVNAAHAIPEKAEISIQTFQENSNVIIRICDTGTGISKDNIDKIFDAFFTTKEPGKGTGLGLSISFRIITDHNGTIAVESEEGKGTTFTICLPIKQTSGQLLS